MMVKITFFRTLMSAKIKYKKNIWTSGNLWKLSQDYVSNSNLDFAIDNVKILDILLVVELTSELSIILQFQFFFTNLSERQLTFFW